MADEHNTRLSSTVDRLLSESNEKLQQYLQERMQTLEEKSTLTQELENLQSVLQQVQAEKSSLIEELAQTRRELYMMNDGSMGRGGYPYHIVDDEDMSDRSYSMKRINKGRQRIDDPDKVRS